MRTALSLFTALGAATAGLIVVAGCSGTSSPSSGGNGSSSSGGSGSSSGGSSGGSSGSSSGSSSGGSSGSSSGGSSGSSSGVSSSSSSSGGSSSGSGSGSSSSSGGMDGGFACMSPGDCGGNGEVCCGTIPLTGGNPPNCTSAPIMVACTQGGSCATALGISCSGNQVVRLCKANSDCTEASYNQCCTFPGMGSSLVFCANSFIASFAGATCM